MKYPFKIKKAVNSQTIRKFLFERKSPLKFMEENLYLPDRNPKICLITWDKDDIELLLRSKKRWFNVTNSKGDVVEISRFELLYLLLKQEEARDKLKDKHAKTA